MAISSLSTQFSIGRELASMRAQMFDLQRQLATGKKAETYGGLGIDRLSVLTLRHRTASMDGFLKTINLTLVRVSIIQTHLERMREIAANQRSEGLVSQFDLVTTDQTRLQVSAEERLNEMVSLMNFELGGRHFFSGKTMDTEPVVAMDLMLEGDGTRAGLKQVIAERKLADLGADGRGRLVIPVPGAGTVSVSEDAAPSPYGFKLVGAINNLTGTTVTGPAGAPPNMDVDFTATLPNTGETFQLLLDLPDGTRETVELIAVAGVPANGQEFQIGIDADATAVNFQAALATAIEGSARTELTAASAISAANDFFVIDDANPPRRVAGTPLETSTAQVNGTVADTVFWYVGDADASPARDSAVAKVDKSLIVSYGVRANEQAPTIIMSSLAVLAATTYSASDPDAEGQYDALRLRVNDQLSFGNGAQSAIDMISELGFKQNTLDKARERHLEAQVATDNLLEQFENADIYEISVQLLALQVQLQASFEATALIFRMTIVNFI